MIFWALGVYVVLGGTSANPQVLDDVAMLRRAMAQAKTLQATLLVKRPGEASLPVKIALSKPDRLWVQVSGLTTRGNGQVIEQLSVDGVSKSKLPSTPSTVLGALGSDYLRAFRLFFAPEKSSDIKITTQADEIRGGLNFKVFDIVEKDRPSASIRLVVDPRDWLPREMALSNQGSDLTRVMISSIQADSDVTSFDFGKAETATTADVNNAKERKLRLDEFYQAHVSTFPLGTSLAVSGAFPASFSKVRSASLTLLVDGEPYASQTITGDWTARWTPAAADSKKYLVRIEAAQGSEKVVLAEREISILKNWSLSPRSIKIGDDGLARIEPGAPLGEGWEKFQIQWNGNESKSWLTDGLLVIECPKLMPGSVNISGQLVRSDGVTFPIEAIRANVEPVFKIEVPISSCRVDLSNADQELKLSPNRQLDGITGWRLWVNGVDIADGKGAVAASPTYDMLISGKNEVVLELIRGRTSLFSQAHTISAEVDVAVQRRQVAELLLRSFGAAFRYRLSVLLKLQEQLPSGVLDPSVQLPLAREFTSGAQLMKDVASVANPKMTVTIDHSFNDRAKAVTAKLKDVMDYCVRNAELLNFAYGYGQQVRRGGRLEDTLRAMLQALDNSRGATESAKSDLAAINAFFKEHGKSRTEPFSLEESGLKQTGEGSRVTHYHRVLLQAVLMIASGVDNDGSLIAAKSFIERNGDAPYRAKLLVTVESLREVIKLKFRLNQITEEIRLLERARAKATSDEERTAIAKRIGDLRVEAERTIAAIAQEQTIAWEAVEASGAMVHVDLSGAFEKAPK